MKLPVLVFLLVTSNSLLASSVEDVAGTYSGKSSLTKRSCHLTIKKSGIGNNYYRVAFGKRGGDSYGLLTSEPELSNALENKTPIKDSVDFNKAQISFNGKFDNQGMFKLNSFSFGIGHITVYPLTTCKNLVKKPVQN